MREGRRGRELRIDGTFASWYDPSLPITGSVWDALAIPLLLLPAARRRNVLVLGLGGGSVARVIRALAPAAHVVGVEQSREVLDAARRWLDLDELGVEVVVDDAHAYLEASRRRFDLVVEDVFVGRGRAVRKPAWLPVPGSALAARRLLPGGLLVSNTIDESAAVARELQRLFPSLLSVEVEDFDNRVLVAGRMRLEARALRAAVRAEPILAATLPRLRFRTLRPRGGATRA
ncbi:MAG: methyltransferase domain-containing protein [Myxococcota bacterium]|nr:methyltransferase domain-containing protein [Myxococcota bacterium]